MSRRPSLGSKKTLTLIVLFDVEKNSMADKTDKPRTYVPPSQRSRMQSDSFSSVSDLNSSPGLKLSISTPSISTEVMNPNAPFVSVSGQTKVKQEYQGQENGYEDGTRSVTLGARSFDVLLNPSTSGSNLTVRHIKSQQRLSDKLDMLIPPPEIILFKRSAENKMIIDYNSMEPANIKIEYPQLEGKNKGVNKGNFRDLDFKDFSSETLQKLGFPQDLIRNVGKLRYTQPTPIQENAIPLVLSSMDLLATSQTGSGKTFSFLSPIIAQLISSRAKDAISDDDKNMEQSMSFPLAVILSPTRELTQQIAFMCYQLTFKTNLIVRLVYGGEGAREQRGLLKKGCDIVIATPGRLKDFLERRCLSLKYVRVMVLDEADKMLDMGFEPQIRDLVYKFDMPGNGPNGNRQTLMFSATFGTGVQAMAKRYLHNEARIHVGQIGSTTTTIKQQFEYFAETAIKSVDKRIDKLIHILKSPGSIPTASFLTLIFVETKKDIGYIITKLLNAGLRVCEMHGDLEQRERQNNLKSFKDGKTPVLVATDVAQRGIDIGAIRHVINFDFPKDIDTYIHRIGRTGRAGAEGLATSFILLDTPHYILRDLKNILLQSKQPLPKFLQDSMPSKYGQVSGRVRSREYEFVKKGARIDSDEDLSDSSDCAEQLHSRSSRHTGASEAVTPAKTPAKPSASINDTKEPAERWD